MMRGTSPGGPGLAALLKDRWGLSVADPELLDLALRHASIDRTRNNQRLEFLGDRVLGLIIATRLYKTYPGETEGELALRHAALVRAETLAQSARELGLGTFLSFSDNDRNGGIAALDNVLADGLEALIGALYLDGGLPPCETLIAALWDDRIATMTRPPQDPKSALQEWAQGRGLPLPTYTIEGREGPDHAPVFRISVSLPGKGTGHGEGLSRRIAEKEAAQNLLSMLTKETPS